MRILFASSELAPLAQTGGLGEAVRGLALALAARGHDVECLLPGYARALSHPACPPLTPSGDLRVALPGGVLDGRCFSGLLAPRVRVTLFDLPALYQRAGLYGYEDDPLRFLVFSRAAAYRAEATGVDVLVAHDWHAAMSIATLRVALDRGSARGIGAALVVHNNAFQGRCDPSLMRYTGLPQELFHADGLEAWGDLTMLKGGLAWADRIIAVSPTYARELGEPWSGLGLEGVYSQRAQRLVGIANGIDTARYDPGADPALVAPFDAHDAAGKAQCRQALLRELALDPEPGGLLLGAVGRFSRQKGWDVMSDSLDTLVQRGHRVALLGDGDVDIASRLTEVARRHPRRVAVRVAFDEQLSRRIYAGTDVVLVPSRFEPCGLVQLIAQRYGAIPVAHATGGLRDTIVDERDPGGAFNDEKSTGVLFSPLTSEALVEAVLRVEPLLEAGTLGAVQRRLCGLDVSFDAAARAYEQVLLTCSALGASRLV